MYNGAMRTPTGLSLALLVLLPIACGDTVDTPANSASTTSSSGSGGSGGQGSGGDGGGSSTCSPAPTLGGSFSWSYEGPDGTPYDCGSDSGNLDLDVDGTIATGSSESAWIVDECPAGTGCQPILHTVAIFSDLPITPPPVGTFVHLRAKLAHVSGPPPVNCQQSLLISNIPALGNTPNPNADDGLPWLDPLGDQDDVFSAAYDVYCSIDHPDPGCSWTESFYKVSVSYANDPTASTSGLLPTEVGILNVSGPDDAPIPFTARYVVSSNGNCENPGNSAVWVARLPSL